MIARGRAPKRGTIFVTSRKWSSSRKLYSCACSHSRRAAFICDCQPRPRARNFSTTSVSKRMVVETFLLPTGRPRFARYAAMPASISAAVRGRSSWSFPSQTKYPPGGGVFIPFRMALRVGRGVFLIHA